MVSLGAVHRGGMQVVAEEHITQLLFRPLRLPPLTHSARLDRSTPARLRLVLLALPALKPTTPSGCSTAASTAPSRARTRSYIP